MGKHNVPGIKQSGGMKGFPVLPAGEYKLLCTKADVVGSDKEPADLWKFQWDILEGPPTDDGKASKGQKFATQVRILAEEHPDYDRLGSMGVDELKSMVLAAGVSFKGEEINEQSFVGQSVFAKVVQTPSKTDPEKIFNNVRAWKSI